MLKSTAPSEVLTKTALLVLQRIETKIDEAKQREEDKEYNKIKTLSFSLLLGCCLWIGFIGPFFYGTKKAIESAPNGVRIEWNLFPKINWQGIDLPPFTSKKKKEETQEKQPTPGNFPNPVPGARLSSPFGYRIHPVLGYRKFHNGQDLAAPTGTPIKAPMAGKVLNAGWLSDACGNGIKITHAGGFETSYCHLSKINVRPGDSVKGGVVIGLVGNTGRSTGPHLHLTLKKDGDAVDPVKYFIFKER